MKRCRHGRWYELALGATALVAAAALLSACGSGSPSTNTSAGQAGTKSANGLPNLHGVTITLGKAAGAPQVEDTVSYIQVQILKQWGANASLTLVSDTGPAAVLAGKLDAAGAVMSGALNAGLVVFGPSQARLDYVLVGAPGITSVRQLKGKPFPIGSSGSEDDFLIGSALRQVGLPTSAVSYVVTGGTPGTVADFIAGRVSGAWVHADEVPVLRQKGVKFNVITTSSKVAPWAMDSVEFATKSWLASHASVATAIDLAWLYAARIFNDNSAQFAHYAQQYTHGASSMSQIMTSLKIYRTAQLFPLGDPSFNAASLRTFLKDLDVFSPFPVKVSLNSPESSWTDLSPWEAALKEYNEHPTAVS